jgi:excinuclease ABC subunit C
MSEGFKAQLDGLPEGPGCYLFRNAAGQIIYVGKARSLRDRVRSYFRPARGLEGRLALMVGQVDRIEHISTGTEVEALILESNLVKQHHPRFNILLRDDKHFPYVRIDLGDEFPRPAIVRRIVKDGARYFGPYTDAEAIREALRAARRVFPFRTCTDYKMKTVTRPCLDHQVRRCLAPCHLPVMDYQGMMRELCLFLEGRQEEVVGRLRERMERAAGNLDFEKAAELRDQIEAAVKIAEKQRMVSAGLEDRDVVGVARDLDEAYAQVFVIRGGKLIGREHFVLSGVAGQTDGAVLAAFTKQYYAAAASVPPSVFFPSAPDESPALREYLSALRGGRVAVEAPRRGPKAALVELARQNAEQARDEHVAAARREMEMTGEAVADLAERLGLAVLPARIECYDISNLQGREAVGSMVVFEQGRPKPAAYRRFKIRTVEGADDFAMLREVLGRRFRRAGERGSEGGPGREAGSDSGFAAMPDLIIVDGGRGQVSSAAAALAEARLSGIPVYGLAKEFERLFLPDATEPIILPPGSKAIRLLQRARDEAHRFALGYHRGLREKRVFRSALDDIPGVGPARRTLLLRHFGSVAKMRQAVVEDFAGVPGIGPHLAQTIVDHLARRRKDGEKREGP